MKKNILFIGLGRMGFPMAGHLSKNADFSISIGNRSPEKIERWLKEYSGHKHSEGQQYDAIVLCVGNDEDVRDNLINSQIVDCLKSDGIIIDHTTTSAALAKKISKELAEKSFRYLDAPVSGGEVGAINGKLSCMVGGEGLAFTQSSDIFTSYCHNVVHVGESGAGQIAKMANQLCIAGVLAGLSEAVMLVENAGVDAGKVYQAIKGGAAQSWQLDNRFETMVSGDYDFGFAIEHMIKDLNYSLEEVRQQNWEAKVASSVMQEYLSLREAGYAGNDTSVLVEQYRKSKDD